MTGNGINKITHSAERPSSGVGYVVLNANRERADYIRECYKNGTIAIVTDKGEVIKSCIVEADLFRYIDFPKTKDKRGTCIVWIEVPDYNRPIIIGVIGRKDQLNSVSKENTFHIKRE